MENCGKMNLRGWASPLTDKGFRFLEKYRALKGFIEEFEL